MDNKNIPEEINPILPRLTSSEMANLYASAFKEKKMIFDDFNIKVDKISVAEQRKHMEKQLELLSQISNNTASLRDILDIAKESNDNIEIIIQIFQLYNEKNKQKAESKFKSILGTISTAAKTAETIIKLTTLATTVYTEIQLLL
ncbi:MAG TPA: hypothetical protein PKI60_07250 [Oscillospiraceae bacterium]|nr:hypothetical protein [Oscillospiraceae bacterium]